MGLPPDILRMIFQILYKDSQLCTISGERMPLRPLKNIYAAARTCSEFYVFTFEERMKLIKFVTRMKNANLERLKETLFLKEKNTHFYDSRFTSDRRFTSEKTDRLYSKIVNPNKAFDDVGKITKGVLEQMQIKRNEDLRKTLAAFNATQTIDIKIPTDIFKTNPTFGLSSIKKIDDVYDVD